ncbi:hypothetical protein DXG01_003105 [Tephrocybe rancida]|nr:hypothetical protein DXG01_003105 [Tephrocybe rancida]
MRERLKALLPRSDVARHIKTLILRPNDLMASTYGWFDAEAQISEDLEHIAPALSGLETFIWDGVEPPEETLWMALRKHCPRLRYIGSTVGGLPLSEDSELFNFKDLVGFSLIVNCRARLFLNPDNVHKFPTSLWTMLLERCKNLQELTLGGERTTYYTPLFDVRPIVDGRWPKLHTLTFGHTMMQDSPLILPDWDDISQSEATKEFSRFISAHPRLKKLHIPYDARFPPLEISNSDIVINEFSGTHFYLNYVLPCSQLTALRLCSERLQTWRLADLLPCLQNLQHLSTLELWIDMSHRVNISTLSGLPPEKNAALLETDHIKVFRPLFTACRSLLHLKLMCTTKRKFGFRMKHFWKAIENGPRLRTLEVQKVYSLNEEKMARSALQMTRRVPSLQAITLVYAEQPWSGLLPIRIKQMGVYDLSSASKDHLVRVTAEESGKGLFKPFSRRTTTTCHMRTPAQRSLVDIYQKSCHLSELLYMFSALRSVFRFRKTRPPMMPAQATISTSPSPPTRSLFSSVNVTFLGTASAQPSSSRNHSALALQLGRDVWLFDCGEATQHQLQKSTVKMGRIEKIFITHTHAFSCDHEGDHIFGLIPLLASCLNGAGGTADGADDPRARIDIEQPVSAAHVGIPLEIYGPLGTRAYVRNGMSYSHTLLGSPYVVHELRMPSDPQFGDHTSLSRLACELPSGRNIPQVDGVWTDIFKDDVVSVSAAPILHSVPCVGYVVTEAPVPGKIDPKLYIPDLKRTNTPMTVMRRLQQGESVELSDGTVIHGPPRRKGRKVVILGDTFDPSPIIPLAMDADLLIHEATNAHLPDIDPDTKEIDTYETVEARAKSRGHSTPQMAGVFAKRVCARRLVLNHFSARYPGDETERAIKIMDGIRNLAGAEFGNKVECARDLMSIDVAFPPSVQ